MVLLHYKKIDHNQFLYETTATKEVGEIVQELAESISYPTLVNNMRIKLDIFACCVEDLATHGPLKPEEIRGLTDPELIENALVISPEEKKKWAVRRKLEEGEREN